MTKKKLLELLHKYKLPNETCRVYAVEIKGLLYSIADTEDINSATANEFGRRNMYRRAAHSPLAAA